jgi:hypothetical protein
MKYTGTRIRIRPVYMIYTGPRVKVEAGIYDIYRI